jgi:hypothetical protein
MYSRVFGQETIGIKVLFANKPQTFWGVKNLFSTFWFNHSVCIGLFEENQYLLLS